MSILNSRGHVFPSHSNVCDRCQLTFERALADREPCHGTPQHCFPNTTSRCERCGILYRFRDAPCLAYPHIIHRVPEPSEPPRPSYPACPCDTCHRAYHQALRDFLIGAPSTHDNNERQRRTVEPAYTVYVSQTHTQRWRWGLTGPDKRFLAWSAHDYITASECIGAARTVLHLPRPEVTFYIDIGSRTFINSTGDLS